VAVSRSFGVCKKFHTPTIRLSAGGSNAPQGGLTAMAASLARSTLISAMNPEFAAHAQEFTPANSMKLVGKVDDPCARLIFPTPPSGQIWRTYYFAGSERIALRVAGDPVQANNGVFYLLGRTTWAAPMSSWMKTATGWASSGIRPGARRGTPPVHPIPIAAIPANGKRPASASTTTMQGGMTLN
jgi:hypothetical protein